MKKSFKNKELVVFDMDGTLTPSKAPMRASMGRLLARLLLEKKVAIIGGGKYDLFRWQFIDRFRSPRSALSNLFLFPTSSTAFYRYGRAGWHKVYARTLSKPQKRKIIEAFGWVFEKVGYKHPARTYGGKPIEDRATQITFSALGQKAPIPLKEKWNKTNGRLRLKMARLLQKKLPQLNVRVGGLTSIDVTEKGIDKAYGIRQIEKTLGIERKDMLFVGDAIFPGGNDYAAVRTGVDYVKVSGPRDTEKLVRHLLDKN